MRARIMLSYGETRPTTFIGQVDWITRDEIDWSSIPIYVEEDLWKREERQRKNRNLVKRLKQPQ